MLSFKFLLWRCNPSGISVKKCYSDAELNAVPEARIWALVAGIRLLSLHYEKAILFWILEAALGLTRFLQRNESVKMAVLSELIMTPEMVAKSKENAEKGKYSNVEFRWARSRNCR